MLTRALLLTLLALLAASCGGTSLSEHDLHREIESVQSFAAEGSMLAQGAAESRSTTSLVRVHSEYMENAAKKVETKLDQAHVSADLEVKRATAARLASDVDDALRQLHESPDDRDVARRIQLELSKAADDAEQLAG